jgi:hypothetical protein
MPAPDTPKPATRWSLLTALLIGGLAFALDVRFGVYAANITDSSAYVAAGELWRTGELFRPVPLQLGGGTTAHQALSPLGFRPARERGAEVVEYPLGFPVLIAAATTLGGAWAAYVVAPLMHAVLAWSVFFIARRVTDDVAGLIAATLLAFNPVAVMHGIHPMSDVPAAAAWIAAWAVGLGAGPGAMMASGLLATLAVMIRPNLVPLAAVLGLAWVWRGSRVRDWRAWQWRDGLTFGACGAIGPLIVAWSQQVFYGGVATPGYLGASAFFRLAHVWPNVTTYPRLFVQIHGWLPLLGVVTVAGAAMKASWLCRPDARSIVWTGIAMAGVNAAAYLFYLPYDTAFFLRFFLVSIAALSIGFSAAAAGVARRLWRYPSLRWVAPLVVATAALWPSVRRPDITRFIAGERETQARIQTMGEYLARVLPPETTVLGFFHTGAVSHYAKRNVLRTDLVAPEHLDALVDDLRKGGHSPVFVLDEMLEEQDVRSRFKATRYGALDWPPRAEFISNARIRYWVASDRDRYLAGERWPTDVLR